MHKIVRGIVAGSVIGATVGLAMLMRKKQSMAPLKMRSNSMRMMKNQSRGTVQLVKDQTKHWSNVLKDGTASITQRLAHRNS